MAILRIIVSRSLVRHKLRPISKIRATVNCYRLLGTSYSGIFYIDTGTVATPTDVELEAFISRNTQLNSNWWTIRDLNPEPNA